MKRINWRLAVLLELEHPKAPRVLSTETLCNMISVHRPHIARNTLISVINDLEAFAAIHLVSSNVFLNLRCSPPALVIEAASHIRTNAIISLQSALYAEGVLQNWQGGITAVLPNSNMKVWDREVVYVDQDSFQFHVLPAEYFPPLLGDSQDVMDNTKPYPCFTSEKALLDWIYLEKSCDAELPRLNLFDFAKLNMERLFELAKKMRLRYLLDQFLNDKTINNPIFKTADLELSPIQTQERISQISRLLDSFRTVWEASPNLSFSQILAEVRPKDFHGNFYNVKDLDWEDSLATLRLSMVDNLCGSSFRLDSRSEE